MQARRTEKRARSILALGAVLAAMAGCTDKPPADPADAHEVEPRLEARVVTVAKLSPADPNNVGFSLPDDNVCSKLEDGTFVNAIAPGTYSGLLRNAKCNQQKYVTMARLAQTLGVECNHCHAVDPSDPKKEIYTEDTENKRRANWMYATFVQGLRPVDGSPMRCRHCHTSQDGKPAAKILEDPRDRAYAIEWMHDVMTTTLVEASAKRLRCKTCHVGMAPGRADFAAEVIRQVHFSPGEGLLRGAGLEPTPAPPPEPDPDDPAEPAEPAGAEG